jgi:hypothetical protein
MALLTSCSGVSVASKSSAVLLQETFLTSLVGASRAVSAVAGNPGRGVIFTVGVSVAKTVTYNDVRGLWCL